MTSKLVECRSLSLTLGGQLLNSLIYSAARDGRTAMRKEHNVTTVLEKVLDAYPHDMPEYDIDVTFPTEVTNRLRMRIFRSLCETLGNPGTARPPFWRHDKGLFLVFPYFSNETSETMSCYGTLPCDPSSRPIVIEKYLRRTWAEAGGYGDLCLSRCNRVERGSRLFVPYLLNLWSPEWTYFDSLGLSPQFGRAWIGRRRKPHPQTSLRKDKQSVETTGIR